jgi:hypothetical protein
MSRPINILHPIPKPSNSGIAIVPCGLYCNTALQKVRSGDLVEFWQEWRHEKRRIVQITKFRINTPEFTFMLRCIYGERMTISKLFEQWEAECINEGIGSDGFSRDEALVVEVSNLE